MKGKMKERKLREVREKNANRTMLRREIVGFCFRSHHSPENTKWIASVGSEDAEKKAET